MVYTLIPPALPHTSESPANIITFFKSPTFFNKKFPTPLPGFPICPLATPVKMSYFCLMHTLSQIYIMAVWGVKYRYGLISIAWRRQLYDVIGHTLTQFDGVKPVRIGGTADHIHVLFSTVGHVAEVAVVRKMKSDSSRWINANRLVAGHFSWQRGYAAMSYAYSALPRVIAYIDNQEEHHRRLTFIEEYTLWLQKYGITPDQFTLPDPLG